MRLGVVLRDQALAFVDGSGFFSSIDRWPDPAFTAAAIPKPSEVAGIAVNANRILDAVDCLLA
jgi:hypothetical protein